MILLFAVIVCLILAIICPLFLPKDEYYDDEKQEEKTKTPMWVRGIQACFLIVAAIFFVLPSVYWIDADEVGQFERIYLGDQLPESRIIAMPWQKGPQARIAGPGFHFEAWIKVTHDITTSEVVTVPEGQYGFVTARDGKPFRDGQYLADAWPEGEVDLMQNALYFMGVTDDEDTYEGPRGQMGPQLTVLKPGKYRLNRFLFNVKLGDATDIPVGFVGVIKSNVGKVYEGNPILPTGIDSSKMSVPIVPKGHRGVWNETLTPGRYYLNEIAYVVTPIDTRVQTWKYIGGYKRRWINLEIGDDGKIKQTESFDDVPYNPDTYADRAIVLRVEGWDVFQDSRVQVQVTPENAPFVVASVGGIKEIEDKIITPQYRSIIRNVVAQNVTEEIKGEGEKVTTITRPRRVLDLLYMRESLESQVSDKLIPEARKSGLTVQWVRFGDPAVPPELLVPGKRKQLAKQLEMTYTQEKQAQIARVQTEKERARADQQPVLMESEIGIQVADNKAKARKKLGDGEKYYLTSVAKGQEAQANVLGKEKAAELAQLKIIMDAAQKNPDMIKYPNILVMGDEGGFSGPAAILGANNVSMGLIQKPTPQGHAK